MIQPNMATTLGYVMTDARYLPRALEEMLPRALDRSYHRLSVDGDTSTNDTLVLLANGASGAKPPANGIFEEAAGTLMEDLAKHIARDGEGARKLITIDVRGAKDDTAAVSARPAIANSPLVKTAIAGSDANWGRIIAPPATPAPASTPPPSTSGCKASASAAAAWRRPSTSPR